MGSVEDIRSRIEADGVEFIYAMFVEMHGKPCAKLVPVEALDGLMADGAGFAGFAAGPMGQDPSAPDILAIPDPASYTQLPWQPNVAVMQCDPTVEGELWPYAPRVILRTALASLAERNLVLKSGFEAEYSLVARGEDGTIRVADPLDTDPRPCYDARLLTRMLPHLTEVSKHMNTMGWENYANDHEDANGQFEQNWKYSDALTTADRLILFRFMVHTLAQRDGRYATFMPKPFADRTGNGLHAHMSLWTGDTDEPLFPPVRPIARVSGSASSPTSSPPVSWLMPSRWWRWRVRSSTRTSGWGSGRRLPGRPGRLPTRPTAATTGPT